MNWARERKVIFSRGIFQDISGVILSSELEISTVTRLRCHSACKQAALRSRPLRSLRSLRTEARPVCGRGGRHVQYFLFVRVLSHIGGALPLVDDRVDEPGLAEARGEGGVVRKLRDAVPGAVHLDAFELLVYGRRRVLAVDLQEGLIGLRERG